MKLNLTSYKEAKITALKTTVDREPGYIGIVLKKNGDCVTTNFLSMATTYNDAPAEKTIEIVKNWSLREWLDGEEPSESLIDDIEYVYHDTINFFLDKWEKEGYQFC